MPSAYSETLTKGLDLKTRSDKFDKMDNVVKVSGFKNIAGHTNLLALPLYVSGDSVGVSQLTWSN